jgi:hypothetical protein
MSLWTYSHGLATAPPKPLPPLVHGLQPHDQHPDLRTPQVFVEMPLGHYLRYPGLVPLPERP